MLEHILLPDASCVKLDEIVVQDQAIVLCVSTIQPEATCPHCGCASQRVHSRYKRKPSDLPCAGYRVQHQLTIRRFFCENASCDHLTFAERLPTVVAPYARRTNRLTRILRYVAFQVGGELGAQLLSRIGMPTSPDTLLRLIRRAPEQSKPPPRVLGVDDWAFRKGHSYGTILVDLELQKVVDLLPERNARALSRWLKAHPGVEIISRDRGADYIKGAAEGAPEAIQVADRWHLLKNLRDALERLLHRKTVSLRSAAKAIRQLKQAPIVCGSRPETASKLTRLERDKLAQRGKRKARFDAVKTLHSQDVSIREIARRFGMSRVTVVKYVEADTCPWYPERRALPSKLDPYVPYLQQRWQDGCHNASQLWREICDQGFSGSRGLVAVWAAKHRKSGHFLKTSGPSRAGLTPSHTAWLLVKAEDKLKDDEKLVLNQLCETDDQISKAYELAQGFVQMIHKRMPENLPLWLAAVTESGIGTLQRFANGLRQDLEAVTAALTLPWSNGQVEGQVNRLKLIKRQMYGRANFDLLRKRVLGMTPPAPT